MTALDHYTWQSLLAEALRAAAAIPTGDHWS